MSKQQYNYPRLFSGDNSYREFFTNQFRRDELERAFTWNALEKRGSAFLWEQLGEVDKKFLENAVFIIVRRKDNREPVYYFYVDRKFWLNSSKDRADHEWIQTHAMAHIARIKAGVKWKGPRKS